MFSRLALAPGETSKDGSLYLYQLRGHSENLYGVFLNACDSNLGDSLGDRPETLAVGFMSIGAHVVIGTLGEVFDDVALEVARYFYLNLEQYHPDYALSLSLWQLIQMDPGRTVQGSEIPLSHPAAWWPFIAITKG